jgi:hypothetical protein
MFFLHSVQTGPGAHPASYAVVTGGSYPYDKAAEDEADHSPRSGAEVKDGGAIPPLPYMSSLHSA